MKIFLLLLAMIPSLLMAQIEDNSFLIDEAYNQEWGVYQFIQRYQTFEKTGIYEYMLEVEIPISDKVHQLSFDFGVGRAEEVRPATIDDLTFNYRYQIFNNNQIIVTEQIGLITPTGKVEEKRGTGVLGLELMQAASIVLGDYWINHWNFGLNTLPDAKTSGQRKRRTLTGITAGTSYIYLLKDNFNLMFEVLLESGQELADDGSKITETTLTLNPGVRWSWNLNWKDTQIVPGISFPTEHLKEKSEYGVLFYLSIEPKFY